MDDAPDDFNQKSQSRPLVGVAVDAEVQTELRMQELEHWQAFYIASLEYSSSVGSVSQATDVSQAPCRSLHTEGGHDVIGAAHVAAAASHFHSIPFLGFPPRFRILVWALVVFWRAGLGAWGSEVA